MKFKIKPRDLKTISDIPLYTPEYMCKRFGFKTANLTKLCAKGVFTETEDFVWIVLNDHVTRLFKQSAIAKLSARKTGVPVGLSPYMTNLELRAFKEKYKLTNVDIAKGCGFHKQAISRWLNNKVQISRKSTLTLRKYFAKLEKQLLESEEQPE